MAAKTRKPVDFQRLADTLPSYPFAYLITVGDDYRAHTVTVEPVLRDFAVLDIGLIGGGTRTNLAHRSNVTLVWPPPEPGGYSLIVDGRAEISDAGAETVRCAVTPTRALLHRNADSPSVAQGCVHDCVVFSLPAGAAP
jgi:hypothetical protein